VGVVVSFRIDKKLKEKMEKFRYINWSEVVRRAIEDVIKREEAKLREKDVTRLRIAAIRTDQLRRKIPKWSSVEEIRR